MDNEYIDEIKENLKQAYETGDYAEVERLEDELYYAQRND